MHRYSYIIFQNTSGRLRKLCTLQIAVPFYASSDLLLAVLADFYCLICSAGRAHKDLLSCSYHSYTTTLTIELAVPNKRFESNCMKYSLKLEEIVTSGRLTKI